MTQSSRHAIKSDPDVRKLQKVENRQKALALLNHDLLLEKARNDANPLRDMVRLQNFLCRTDEIGGRVSEPSAIGPDIIRYGRVNPFRVAIVAVSGLLMFFFFRLLNSWIEIEDEN